MNAQIHFIPPLRNGERLTRQEFERRYEAMPHVKKAELIEGVVYMGSPVSFDHADPHSILNGCFLLYRMRTPGVTTADNATVRFIDDNEPQPDAALMIEPKRGGQARISEDHYIEGAPELLAEVAASSVKLDLGDKLKVYQRHGVREYLVWRVLEKTIDWFVLRDGKFAPLRRRGGIHRNEVFPGLWLDTRALCRGDLQRVDQVLHEGLASREHQDFVDSLAAK